MPGGMFPSKWPNLKPNGLRRCMDEADTIGTMAVSHESDFLVPMAAYNSPWKQVDGM